MRRLHFALLSLVLVLAAQPLFATTYYVSPNPLSPPCSNEKGAFFVFCSVTAIAAFAEPATTTFVRLVDFNGPDGVNPASLVQGTDGSLYGTTSGGGLGDGTVFKITSAGELITLYSFCSQTNCTDGANPVSVVQVTNGKFYGTTNGGGTFGDGTLFDLSVGLGPFVEAKPTYGEEGTKIGILGQGFSSSSVIKFGGTKATTIVLSGTTFITATVPAGALTGSLTVTTGTTTLATTKTFKVLPTITSFTPESGPVGTSVSIKGTGLEQTMMVTFDGKSATFTVISDTEVMADVPIGAATGRIAVTTKGGSATSATSFTVK